MGYSDKYGYVSTTRHGRTGPIGESEPVAVIRAQDMLAVPTLRDYLKRCRKVGCSQEHIASIERQIENFRQWQESEFHQMEVRRPGDQPLLPEDATATVLLASFLDWFEEHDGRADDFGELRIVKQARKLLTGKEDR
jgi:hypothetical protein